MKSYHKELWLNIEKRMDFINITPDVEQAVIESGIKEGLCLVNAMHITASVFINDDEQGLHRDYKSWLCLLYTSPSPRDFQVSRMPSSA